nr:cytochrome P450 2F2-like [Pogona vitticeps]
MFELTEFLILLILSLLIVQFLKLQWMRQKLPPGPTPLPIIGNLWHLGFVVKQESLLKLKDTYGNIFTMWMGQTPVVVLNGYEAVKEGLVTYSEETSGRAKSPLMTDLMGEKGIFVTSGHTWKQQKRFVMTTLRNLGVGKKDLENRVQVEAHKLLKLIASKQGSSFEPKIPIVRTVGNVICSFVFGDPFPQDDDSFNKLIKAVYLLLFVPFTFWGRLYDACPTVMSHMKGLYREVFESNAFIHNLVREKMQSHKERWRRGQENHDLIDFYLDQIAKSKDDPSSTFNEENLVQTAVDLLIGGIETVANTLCWGLCYLLKYPDVQEKIQNEIDAVMGRSQIITYEDRVKLPYTNAVLHETLRFSSVTGIATMRCCLKDMTLLGFPIAKGTFILPNKHSVLYDPDCWETPWKFNPGHFLDSEGNFVNNDAFIPYAIGRRACLGEPLAQTELFVFFANLLHAFKFQLPDGIKDVSLESIVGGTREPRPFEILAIPH